MSWDTNQDNSYYGNYNYNYNQNPDASYDMYAGQPQQPNQQSYYNPNEYQQPQANVPQQPQPPPQQPQTGPGGFAIPGQILENPMMANMAMEYGQNIVGKGGEELRKNLDKYVSIGQLKYYFAVDTTYVGKKLGVLLFPFTRSDWSVKYNQEEPVQPKYDVNAPDLYIPSMAYVTYVLVVGYILGVRNAFSPDQLATTASSLLVWLVLEITLIYVSMTVMSINTNMCKWDILSFSTYKYVVMILLLFAGLIFGRQGYYLCLVYASAALGFFLIRTLKLRIEPEVHGMQQHGKRKMYLMVVYALLQPLLMWWMTSYFLPVEISSDS